MLCDALEVTLRRAKRAGDALVVGELGDGGVEGFGELLARRQKRAPAREFRLFTRLWVECADLAMRVAQEILLALGLRRFGSCVFHRRGRGAPGGIKYGKRAHPVIERAEKIERLAMGRGIEQSLVFELTMNFDESAAHLAQ